MLLSIHCFTLHKSSNRTKTKTVYWIQIYFSNLLWCLEKLCFEIKILLENGCQPTFIIQILVVKVHILWEGHKSFVTALENLNFKNHRKNPRRPPQKSSLNIFFQYLQKNTSLRSPRTTHSWPVVLWPYRIRMTPKSSPPPWRPWKLW